MSIFDDIQQKADINGDGKLTTEDLDQLREKYGLDDRKIADLRATADANGDGKLDVDDLKTAFGNFGTTAETLKDRFFGGKN